MRGEGLSTCKHCEYFNAARCDCEHPDGEELIMPTSDACELFEPDCLAFLSNMPKNMERGKTYEWACPCGGTVRGGRSPCNGHLHASCDKCGMGIMQ